MERNKVFFFFVALLGKLFGEFPLKVETWTSKDHWSNNLGFNEPGLDFKRTWFNDLKVFVVNNSRWKLFTKVMFLRLTDLKSLKGPNCFLGGGIASQNNHYKKMLAFPKRDSDWDQLVAYYSATQEKAGQGVICLAGWHFFGRKREGMFFYFMVLELSSYAQKIGDWGVDFANLAFLPTRNYHLRS